MFTEYQGCGAKLRNLADDAGKGVGSVENEAAHPMAAQDIE
jgi:hypothetical protein